MLTIIDTKAGNFNSIINAFKRIGVDTILTDDVRKIKEARALVLPGVAAFEKGMTGLNENNLADIIKSKVIEERTPIIGICLGMQLLAENSEEHGRHKGLGLIKGNVVKLNPDNKDYKVPNIGWCDVSAKKEGVIFHGDYTTSSFYHVHSYHLQCANSNAVAASIEYGGGEVTVAIEQDNIFGVQFHPEKSQDAGLELLDRFAKYTNNIC
ncbi:MAG: imidazole glycerol phosphate synthase subunit HisH [Proteobacteria bacterium]|nr:imidazole glycerol phosphate synthase subunit HisH [Pseudomonadota bacterium]MDA0967657.1 imidazole glycerol phosphate synthase subunit HisH [Pseudomonadota bacterium]MDG4544498.1 imidazole glycerol phosphate synthase subunit HisH [Rickettsiales bacterium]MDG4548785.1 imidazole glycerol phosphate synthase subunit HisH [Rickettsiales bacterium]